MVAITIDLLERIAKERRFEQRTLDVAKRLFIHQEKPKRVASEFGINLARVYAIRKDVLAAAATYELPPGWVRTEIEGPADLVQHYKNLFEEALAAIKTK